MAAGICLARSAAQSLARHLYQSLQPRRAFRGAAAAAAVDYESELEEEYGYGLCGAPEATKDAWGEREGRGVRWVFMGSPAAQKHMYATRIADLLAVPHISMGTLVRQELDPSSSLYKKVPRCLISWLSLGIAY